MVINVKVTFNSIFNLFNMSDHILDMECVVTNMYLVLFLCYCINHVNCALTIMKLGAFMMYQIGPQAILSFYAMGLIDTIINSESVHVSCGNSYFLILFRLLKGHFVCFDVLCLACVARSADGL